MQFTSAMMRTLVDLMEASSEYVGMHPDDVKNHLQNGSLYSSGAIDHHAGDALQRLTPDINVFSPAHRQAINIWAGDNNKKGRYREINDHLRRGTPLRSDIRGAVPALQSAVQARPLEVDTHVYRGVHAPLSHAIEALEVGEIYRDPAFLSTSISPAKASYYSHGNEGVMMHIFLPKGSSAIYMDHPEITPFSEKEVLLLPNSALRFLGYTEYQHHRDGPSMMYHFQFEGTPADGA